MRAYTDMAVLP